MQINLLGFEGSGIFSANFLALKSSLCKPSNNYKIKWMQNSDSAPQKYWNKAMFSSNQKLFPSSNRYLYFFLITPL